MTSASKRSLSPTGVQDLSLTSLPPAASPGLQSILKHRASRNTSSPDARSDLLSLSLPPSSSVSGSSTPLSRTSTLSAVNYQQRVAFDLLESGHHKTGGGTGIDFSFTLQVKSIGYQRTRVTREFLVATDVNNEYSVNALTWLLENLVEDGDEVVVVRVVEPNSSPICTDAIAQDAARQEAQDLMDSIMDTNKDERQLSIIVEFAVGRVEAVIQRMIQIYRPDSLVVGTRGRSMTGWKASLMGSTSRYMLEKSPVPVVVVRPERKVHRDLELRRADPKRGFAFTSPNSSRSGSPVRPNIDRTVSEDAERRHTVHKTLSDPPPIRRPDTAPG